MNYYGRYKTFGTAIRIIETDEYFDTRTQCADYLGVNVSMISMCLSGRVKTCKGYHIEIVDKLIIHALDQETLDKLYDMTGVYCEWRIHPFRPNVYVSDTGMVAKSKRGRLEVKAQHIINSGYLVASVGDIMVNRSKNSNQLVHRLVAETYIDNVYGKPDVNHRNGNKFDNNVSNLEWCTKSENMRHAYDNCLRSSELVRIVETGQVYKSFSECARAIGGTISGIHDCKTGRQRRHRGYHFEFPGGIEIYECD